MGKNSKDNLEITTNLSRGDCGQIRVLFTIDQWVLVACLKDKKLLQDLISDSIEEEIDRFTESDPVLKSDGFLSENI